MDVFFLDEHDAIKEIILFSEQDKLIGCAGLRILRFIRNYLNWFGVQTDITVLYVIWFHDKLEFLYDKLAFF